MLMAWGPFRFTVPTYSVESIRRSLQPRVSPVPLISRVPSLHRLGPGNEQITLESTFHPHHLNGRGLAQLAAVRQAVNALTPLPLVHLNGSAMNVFGPWVATQIEDSQSMLDPLGKPGTLTVSMTMLRDDASPARGIAISATANFDIGLDFSIELGF